MEINKIIDYINRSYIASDYLRAPDVYYYMDLVIDDINDRLQSKFPTFTDWAEFVDKWNNWVAGPQPIPGEGLPDMPSDVAQPEHYKVNSMYGPHLNPELVAGYNVKPTNIRRNDVYDAFPDKYIRTVVALGVAVKFYTRDEEGEQIAYDYQNRYETALFNMTRDYHNQVPWYFQENTGGFIDFSYNREELPVDLVPRGVVLRGDNTRIL